MLSGDWSDAVNIWTELLDKSVGCYSAEIGIVCGFRFLDLTCEDKRIISRD